MNILWTLLVANATPVQSWCDVEGQALHIRQAEIELALTADGARFVAATGSASAPLRAPPTRQEAVCPSETWCQYIAQLRVQGRVESSCELGPREAAAVISDRDGVRVWRWRAVAGNLDGVTLPALFAQTLSGAMPDAVTARAVVHLAVQESWSERPAVLRAAMRHVDPAVRGAAARLATDRLDAAAVAALWLLAHDVDPEVRGQALKETARACRHHNVTPCAQAVWPFAADADDDVAFAARDLLLALSPALALRAAPQRYKLDLLAQLAERFERTRSDLLGRALFALTQDSDPAVAEPARSILNTLER